MRKAAFPGVLVLLAACSGREPKQSTGSAPLTAEACRPCHQEVVEQYALTAHARTSARADSTTIRGDFTEGHNQLRTRLPNIFFKLERRPDGHYQTAIDEAKVRTLSFRFDVVIGSGKVGQTYLYWDNGVLYELPVSWLSGAATWINSPGYRDGDVDFGRVILPRCLECHSTWFSIDTAARPQRYRDDYQLGISCAKCHGDGRAHVAWHSAHPDDKQPRGILNPARFPRERRLDNCGLCHGGGRTEKRPAFTYRPGEPLDDYFQPSQDLSNPSPDVHGNQVELLRRTACFKGSPGMTCATCHDVHRTERDLTRLAQKCLACHQAERHPFTTTLGEHLIAGCIDCHMPTRKSNILWVNTPTGRFSPSYRSHAIAIYP